MVDLRIAPFCLSDEQIKWVEHTKKSLSLEEKIGQLFCFCSRYNAGGKAELDEFFSVAQPGAIMLRPMELEKAVEYQNLLQEKCKIPLLVAANLESGGNGIVAEGTHITSPMGIAATGKVEFAEKLGAICAREGSAVGGNWAFAPIIDIDFNFRNPITNTRTFGSDPHTVKDFGRTYVETVQENGMAACIKHFPGDGCDERDQHLVTTINDLTCEEWDETYGMVYRECIQAGAMSVMVGHIMQPAWSRRLNPSLKDEDLLPASLSRELLNGLLREHLDFNGLICTDASTMCGYAIALDRRKALPLSIEAGCDMILFTKNLQEDYSFVLEGYRNGQISEERLEDALSRVLGMKAALKLPWRNESYSLEKAEKVVGCPEHQLWAREAAEASITLVKNLDQILPLSSDQYKRILYVPLESEKGVVYSAKDGVCQRFAGLLEKEGFEITVFEPDPALEGNMRSYQSYLESFDLILYAANIVTKSNQTTVRIEWKQPMGADVPIFITTIPTVFVSFENPYHLLDVPRIRTFINAYSSTDDVQEVLVDKLMGRSEFKGQNPVDAFCGKWDTHL